MKISRQFYVHMSIVGLTALVFFGCSNPNNIAELAEDSAQGDSTPTTYTMTFIDSSDDTVISESTDVEEGSTISEPSTPTRSGYVFSGWYKDEGLTDVWNFSTDTVTNDMTLYAKWNTAPIYTISFDPNEAGYGSVPAAQMKTQGVDITLPGNAGELKKSEHIFDGWYTETGGTRTDYAPGDSYSTDGDTTLYADWMYIGAKPVIKDVTFEGPATIDTSTGDQTVSFTVTAEDDMELDRASVAVANPSGNSVSQSIHTSNAKYSGTSTSGTFTIDITIPEYAEAGTWKVSAVQVYDHLNNSISYSTSFFGESLADAGWDYTFEQIGTGDTEEPTITDVTFEGPATIDTSTGEQTVSFTVTAEDNMEVARAFIAVANPSGNSVSQTVYTSNDEYSGTSTFGTFTIDITIPQYAEAGTWNLNAVQVYDHLNNRISYSTSFVDQSLADAGWDYTFVNN